MVGADGMTRSEALGAMAGNFGQLLKEIRKQRNLGLREFCLENGIDPGNYSRLERGQFLPPQNVEQIEKYAVALGVDRGSDTWLELVDLAAAGRGEIPADLMSDGDLVEKLPVFFRTLRANQLSPEKLDELVERIRRS